MPRRGSSRTRSPDCPVSSHRSWWCWRVRMSCRRSNCASFPSGRGLARWALRDVRISRAYEGFYLESVDNPDFDALALHSLENLPGWNADVRIELRHYRFDGQKLDSIGRDDAGIRRTLVVSDSGVFQACDEQGNVLHSGADLFTSILQALPDAERNALQIQIGQGPVLKAALRDNALKPYRLLSVLSDLPELKSAAFDPTIMRLRGGAPRRRANSRSCKRSRKNFRNSSAERSIRAFPRLNDTTSCAASS